MTFTDEINRLFDELVHDPWSRARAMPAGGPAQRETQLDFEMPIAGGQLGDISISLQGRMLMVRARRRSAASGGDEPFGGERHLERSFVLPEAAEVSAIEARIKDEILHIRVWLRIAA